MNPLVKILNLSRFERWRYTAFSHSVSLVTNRTTNGININSGIAEVVSRKGLLIPLHISIYQALKLFWLEMIVIKTTQSSLLRINRALRKNFVNSVFDLNAPFSVRRMIRETESSQPSRINENYLKVKVNCAIIHWLGIYNELHITISGRPLIKMIQPCIVVCHTFNTDWREALPVQSRTTSSGSVVQDVFINPDKVKCYVAQELDKVYTWDKAMRNYLKKEVIPQMVELNIEIVYMPMAELRDSLIHAPDFSKINPFAGTAKLIMDVKTSRNYHSAV